jgi:3',5'-cyclic AMP phosphodiesterase CpdA
MTDAHLLTFIHISDTHLNPDMDYTNPYARYHPAQGMAALTAALQTLPFTPDFVLHTGDIAFDPHPDIYDDIRRTMAQLPFPVHYVAGNHDDTAAIQRVLMQRPAAAPYLYYELEINGVQLIVLDSNGPAELPAGHIPAAELDWLDALCSADDDRPLVIATHHNVVAVGVPWLDDYMRTNNGQALHEIILKARHRLRGVFHGHIHQAVDVLRDGVLYVSAASPWCQFASYPGMVHTAADPLARPGYNVVTLTRTQTYIRRHTLAVEG